MSGFIRGLFGSSKNNNEEDDATNSSSSSSGGGGGGGGGQDYDGDTKMINNKKKKNNRGKSQMKRNGGRQRQNPEYSTREQQGNSNHIPADFVQSLDGITQYSYGGISACAFAALEAACVMCHSQINSFQSADRIYNNYNNYNNSGGQEYFEKQKSQNERLMNDILVAASVLYPGGDGHHYVDQVFQGVDRFRDHLIQVDWMTERVTQNGWNALTAAMENRFRILNGDAIQTIRQCTDQDSAEFALAVSSVRGLAAVITKPPEVVCLYYNDALKSVGGMFPYILFDSHGRKGWNLDAALYMCNDAHTVCRLLTKLFPRVPYLTPEEDAMINVFEVYIFTAAEGVNFRPFDPSTDVKEHNEVANAAQPEPEPASEDANDDQQEQTFKSAHDAPTDAAACAGGGSKDVREGKKSSVQEHDPIDEIKNGEGGTHGSQFVYQMDHSSTGSNTVEDQSAYIDPRIVAPAYPAVIEELQARVEKLLTFINQEQSRAIAAEEELQQRIDHLMEERDAFKRESEELRQKIASIESNVMKYINQEKEALLRQVVEMVNEKQNVQTEATMLQHNKSAHQAAEEKDKEDGGHGEETHEQESGALQDEHPDIERLDGKTEMAVTEAVSEVVAQNDDDQREQSEPSTEGSSNTTIMAPSEVTSPSVVTEPVPQSNEGVVQNEGHQQEQNTTVEEVTQSERAEPTQEPEDEEDEDYEMEIDSADEGVPVVQSPFFQDPPKTS